MSDSDYNIIMVKKVLPAGPQDHKTARPQDRKTARPQDRKTAGPQDRKTARPQDYIIIPAATVSFEPSSMNIILPVILFFL